VAHRRTGPTISGGSSWSRIQSRPAVLTASRHLSSASFPGLPFLPSVMTTRGLPPFGVTMNADLLP